MDAQALVSIIIPTYNRAHLICETLDSVLAQTYTNWECIIVDDGSTDNTAEVLEDYIERDSRFQYHHRPEEKTKGANACRNHGYELSKGQYVNWFDSDDTMLPKKLESQLKPLSIYGCSFSVSSYADFKGLNVETNIMHRRNKDLELNGINYVLQKVYWGTIDVLISKESIGVIRFHEDLKSGQEYNFFSKLLNLNSLKGIYIDEVLSLRRLHKNSIQSIQTNDYSKYLINKSTVYFYTYLDLKELDSNEVKSYLLNQTMGLVFRLVLQNEKVKFEKELLKNIKCLLGFNKFFFFRVSIFLALNFNKGQKFLNLSRKNNSQ